MNENPGMDRRQFLAGAGVALSAPAIIGPARAAASDPLMVATDSGLLRGRQANGILSFRGVPYAADTGGANRFLAPRPVAGWTGVHDAGSFGARCPQESSGVEVSVKPSDWFSWYPHNAPQSEDCCVLNVYTAGLDAGAKRPVMVYIHGGGFRTGGSDGPALDGSNLARDGDVVVVTLNHRINLFGYLPIGHLDGDFADAANVGQLDLIAALRWIRTNIAAFGGDPDRVLLFGQSGGGSKIATLMIMPSARGLLHRAVNMSGTTVYSMGPAAAREPVTNEFMRVLGLGRGDVRKLQSMPPAQLLTAYRTAVQRLKTDDFRPVIDGRHIPHGPLTPEGLAVHATVPMMMGTTETEATLWLGRDARNVVVTEGQLKDRIQRQFNIGEEQTNALYAAYRADGNATAWDVLKALSTDVLFRGRMLVGAEAKAAARRAPVYLYNFTWNVPVDGGIWDSPHTADIPFAFNNLDKVPTMIGNAPTAPAVARGLMSAFVAFARTGDPDTPALPRWARYEEPERQTMTVGAPSRLVRDFRAGGREACKPLLAQQAYQIQAGPLLRAEL